MRVVWLGLLGGLVMLAWGIIAHRLLAPTQFGTPRLSAAELALPLRGASSTERFGPACTPAEPRCGGVTANAPGGIDSPERTPVAWAIDPLQGNRPRQIELQLARQWGSDSLVALLLACLIRLAGGGFARRFGIACMATLLVCAAMLPLGGWPLLRADFTAVSVLEQLSGWLLAGLLIASLSGSGRKQSRSAYALKPL